MSNVDSCRAPRGLCLSPTETESGLRGLCIRCEKAIPETLASLVQDYSLLDGMLTEPTAGRGGQHVSGTIDSPIPLNAHIDELMGKIVHAATWWEDRVLERLERHSPIRSGLLPVWQLSRATTTLVEYSLVLLHLEELLYSHDSAIAPTRMTGVDAVIHFMRLNAHARANLGVRTLIHKLDGRCMACTWTQTLRREDGSDTVYCCNCRDKMTLDDYQAYLGCFTPSIPALRGRF